MRRYIEMNMRAARNVAVFLAFYCMNTEGVCADISDDKRKHVIAGAAIYGLCVGLGAATDIAWINYRTCLIPTMAAAVGKEIYDRDHNGNPEAADVVATMAVPLLAAGVTFTILEW